MSSRYIDIVFDGPPSHEPPRFIEVEDDKGRSIGFGRWVLREDGAYALRFNQADAEAALSWQT